MLLIPETTQIQRTTIKEERIIPLDQERERTKKLQCKFQNREIQEKDITIDDMNKLKKII